MIVEVLSVVFRYIFPDGYCIGCVRPGKGSYSWFMVYTSTRQQIGSICRELWGIIKQQRRRDSLQAYYRRDLNYKDDYGILPLMRPGQTLKLPNIFGFSTCPTCAAPWPTFRWVWAEAGNGLGVTFCRTDCRRPLFCPPCASMRPYLEAQQAPTWVINLYRQG